MIHGTSSCYAKCGVSCESFSYDLTTAFSNYPTKWYADILLNNSKFLNLVVNNTINYTMDRPTFESMQDTLLMVNVYYDELFYTEIEDEPKLEIEMLLSLIGGYMALFLGMSLLTLVEFIEVGYLIMHYAFIRWLRKRKHKKSIKKKRASRNNSF